MFKSAMYGTKTNIYEQWRHNLVEGEKYHFKKSTYDGYTLKEYTVLKYEWNVCGHLIVDFI